MLKSGKLYNYCEIQKKKIWLGNLIMPSYRQVSKVFSPCLNLIMFYSCNDLMTSRSHVHDELLSGNAGSKVMTPGRIVVLAISPYKGHVAVILKVGFI